MKRMAVIFLAIGALSVAPLVLAAESAVLDSSGVSDEVQKNPFRVTFKPGAERLLKPGGGFPGKNNFGADTAWPVLEAMSKPITYPGWARREGLEGLLVVALEILEDGSVGRWEIMKSTGAEALDKAAEKAFLTWKFKPAEKDGKPIRSCIQIPINFELTEK